MDQELIDRFTDFQGLSEDLKNATLAQEHFIEHMIKFYAGDFEKQHIKRILGSDWKVEEFNEAFFTIVNSEQTTLKIEFDAFGEVWVDPIKLFAYEPISFRDGSYINELKAIVKLYENKEELKEFLSKFIEAIDPMFESLRIYKSALK